MNMHQHSSKLGITLTQNNEQMNESDYIHEANVYLNFGGSQLNYSCKLPMGGAPVKVDGRHEWRSSPRDGI